MSQVYIHIPFCDLKCNYCRFASVGSLQQKKIDFYVKHLITEIKNSTFKSGILNSIYFGGGTPSVLSENNLFEIFDILKEKFVFSKNIEITLESTPNNITKSNLEFWEKLGINRISMGVQTLNQKSLEEIKRGGKGDIIEALEIMKEYLEIGQTHRSAPTKNNVGVNLCVHPIINNISLDFIIGLPYVKKGEILENIKYVLEKYNFIKHISVYMLEDYYSPDKIIETKYDNITYPEDWEKQGIKEEEYLSEYSSIKNFLIKNGFNNYEISNYGKPGFECLHNIGYWEHKEVIAFGLGAYGYINNTRYANSENFKNYYNGEKIFENKLTQEDIFLEKVMFQLRTFGIEESIYKKLDTEKIDYFIENGYLESRECRSAFPTINITDKGVLVIDYILKEIL